MSKKAIITAPTSLALLDISGALGIDRAHTIALIGQAERMGEEAIKQLEKQGFGKPNAPSNRAARRRAKHAKNKKAGRK